ncbi:MAG: hypothetical protein JO332_00030 [Planctomycetaceae bacterium]|nr:hypothetical protein [Planctomycetaceae bacterium]
MAARLVLCVPIPLKDRRHRPLAKSRQRAALRRVLRALGSWFGSATALPSWGSWKEEPKGKLSIDPGQSVVLVLTDPGTLRRRRSALLRLLRQEGRFLEQEQMAVVAFRSTAGSILIRCVTSRSNAADGARRTPARRSRPKSSG